METKDLKASLKRDLEQFTGTEHYYRHVFGITYTDGVKYMAEVAGAYWLLDAVASYARKEPFQVWKLMKQEAGWVLTMQEDSDEPFLVTQVIEFSDFPMDEVTLWLIDGVLILPSEY